jgi:hypothetical protein
VGDGLEKQEGWQLKRYYEILKETDAHKVVTVERKAELHWFDDEVNKGICALLGVESVDENLRTGGDLLRMNDPPEHLKCQFNKPKNGMYCAKKNSAINKAWVKFCKENNLRRPCIWWVLEFKHNLHGKGAGKTITMIGDRYFITSEIEIEADFLKPTTEEEYLTVRLECLKANKAKEE